MHTYTNQVKEYNEIHLIGIFHISNFSQILQSIGPQEKQQYAQTRQNIEDNGDACVVTTFTNLLHYGQKSGAILMKNKHILSM